MRIPTRELAWYGVLGLLLSWCCTVVYLHVLGDLVDGIPAWHQGFLDNEAFAPSQYRWWGFAVPEALTKIGIGIIDAYLVLRFVYLAAAFFVAALIGRAMGLDLPGVSFFVAAVAVFYASATQPHYQPAEEPNLLFFGLAVLLVLLDSKFGWLILVMVLGVLTKSTIGFVLPFYALASLYVLRQPARIVVRRTAVLGAIFVIGYIGVRLYFGTDRPYLGGLWQVDDNLTSLRRAPEEALLWLLPSLVPLLIVARRWDATPLVVKCFVPSAALFVVGHLAISKVEEWRTYTPLALVLWPALLLWLFVEPERPRCV